jgi:hypothetical protein
LRALYREAKGQPWRFLFAFDRERAAIVLTGGCKAGDGRFYERHLRIADKRFAAHQESLGQPVGGRRRKERT